MKKPTILIILLTLTSFVFSQSVVIKDGETSPNTLIQINDEGTTGSITFPSGGTPDPLTNKLYNEGGTLRWNGNPLVTGSSVDGHSLDAADGSPTNVVYVNNGGRVGIGTSTPTAKLHVSGNDGALFTGTYGSGTIPVEGSGTRMMWYPRKGAFRAGGVSSGEHSLDWNSYNIGAYSIAIGYNTRAFGEYSIALGYNTKATNSSSTAFGVSTTASGAFSTAMGRRTIASGGFSSTAMGDSTTASGWTSTAMGKRTTASGDYSTAMGNYVSTNGKEGALVLGDHSTTSVMLASHNNELRARFAGGVVFFTNAARTVGVNLAANQNSWAALSDSTKKENFQIADGEYFLNSIAKLRLGSWNYKSQNPQDFRHYGPMAQEIFHYFGKDDYGTVGNDTTLATADMDGIMMIALQALEKRTVEQAKLIALLTKRIENLESN